MTVPTQDANIVSERTTSCTHEQGVSHQLPDPASERKPVQSQLPWGRSRRKALSQQKSQSD
ncbi:hypothetical protein PISMIDRAFT_680610 [Pisolithus microcarpus 441]|uniref:Uncharacterized protein n=1 Tax=Pisolithus microcarpus 441 TaxID=765257 RepID=A0A0C9ZQV5_9AGAM|nr:hypothetical protein PISMIDRAFT_680610 [Pisolithus microcarpus 441]